MVPADQQLAFLQIPKNASTAIRANKDYNNWTREIPSDVPLSKHVVILRDPTDRFISAVNMYLQTGRDFMFPEPINFENYLKNNKHFVPQTVYMDAVKDFADIDYWMYDSEVVNNIIDYYNLAVDKNVRYNVCNEKVVTSVNTKFIEKHYANDLDLISQVRLLNR